MLISGSLWMLKKPLKRQREINHNWKLKHRQMLMRLNQSSHHASHQLWHIRSKHPQMSRPQLPLWSRGICSWPGLDTLITKLPPKRPNAHTKLTEQPNSTRWRLWSKRPLLGRRDHTIKFSRLLLPLIFRGALMINSLLSYEM